MTVTIPIDFKEVSRYTGIRSGKLCKSKTFGFGVYLNSKPFFASYPPPTEYHGRPVKDVRIVDNCWQFEIE